MASERLRTHRRCPKCAAAVRRRQHAEDPRTRLLQLASQRARKVGLPFALVKSDIAIPEKCPVLGIPLEVGKNKPGNASPSLDRIRGDLGYVRENVRVISYRANRIRNDATVEELEAVLAYAKSLRQK